MRISVLQDRLKDALSIANRFVPSKRFNPVLGNVLLKADDSQLYLVATDMEKSVRVKLNATIDTVGSFTVPASTFSEFVSTLPSGNIVHLEVMDDKLNIVVNKVKSKIAGIDADQFPVIDFGNSDSLPTFSIQADVLKGLLNAVLYSAAKDDSRPILMGVLVTLDARTSELKLVASDGYRLAQSQIASEINEDIKVTVPARFLAEVHKLLNGDDEVQIDINGNSVCFHLGDVVLQSLIIDGKFPDVGSLVPNNCTYKIGVDKGDLFTALKRASIFAPEDSDMVCLTVVGESMNVTSSTQSGDSDNEVLVASNIDTENQLQMHFKAKYLTDALAVLDGEVYLETYGSKHPMKIHKSTSESVHVVMPISKY